MDFTVRKGRKEDLPQVLSLIRELALFEKAPDAVINTVEQMETDGFGAKPVFSFFVAEYEEKIIGIALYFTKYSTWKGKGLFLDDLIVTEEFRGRGVGRKLLIAYLSEAEKSGATQAHWQVLDWNSPAIEFYKKLGARIEEEWLDCKLDREQINALLSERESV